jgi:hypothetical protein
MSGSILDFVQVHPYLFANLPLLGLVLLLPRMTSNRDYERAAIFSGLACLPCSLAEATSAEYWHPMLLGGVHCGVESMIFTYSAGAAVWLLAALWKLENCTLGIRSFRTGFFHLSPWALSLTAVYVGLWLAGMNCVTATLVSSAGLLLFLLVRRLSLWRLALTGLICFTPAYMLELKFEFAAWPNYIAYWNAGGLWGTLVFGIPRGEIAWAAVFGAAYPVVIASAFDIRFDGRKSQDFGHASLA